MHHPKLAAVKVGITGRPERIIRFERRGWSVEYIATFPTGAPAWPLEKAVLSRIRNGLGLSSYLASWQMQGTGGYTETFAAAELSPASLCFILDEEDARLDLS